MVAPGVRHGPDALLTRGTSLGLLLVQGTGAAPWTDLPAAFARLDQGGCDAIWCADHLFWGRPMPEALVLSALAVAATSRCVVGTGVLQLPLRRTAAVAKAAATLQLVSGGRFVLGVGVGEHAEEYRRSGASFSTRGADLDAGIGELRTLWSGEGDGWFVQRPPPPPIPIWVGGRSRAALERAAATADGWMPMFVDPEGYAASMAELDEHLDSIDRERATVVRGVTVLLAVTEHSSDRSEARAWAGRLWNLDPARVDRHLVTGSPERCRAVLQEYRDAGASHVSVVVAGDDPVRDVLAIR